MTNPERARALAQNLLEILTSYEEELMMLEGATPAVGQLRRAVGMTIAEACYWISDQDAGGLSWAPPTDAKPAAPYSQ